MRLYDMIELDMWNLMCGTQKARDGPFWIFLIKGRSKYVCAWRGEMMGCGVVWWERKKRRRGEW
jgi:hypothetical protein